MYQLYQGGLLLNFNIDPKFHGLGIGNAAFKCAYEKLSKHSNIKFIAGNWVKSKEFKHLEGGCCTNFRIFRRGQNGGLSDHEAALETPTGKWAKALGFNKVAIISAKARSVEVRFYKNVADADPDFSFGIESYLLS